jgi:hypothetical protein
MMASDFDIDELLRIEMNKAIEKTLKKNPTIRILNLDEMSTDDITDYFKKSGSIHQLEWILEEGSERQLARWFKVVLGELHTIASNKQS